MENLALPEIFGAQNRYQATVVIREVAAILATGVAPVVAAAWVTAAAGSWIPVAVIIGFFSLCALVGSRWMKEVAGGDLTDPKPVM